MWFYHTVSWFIKTKGLEPVRSRRLQERERSEARLDKPSMQRALTCESLPNLRSHVAASLFGLPLFRMKKRLRISDCRSFSQKVTLAQACSLVNASITPLLSLPTFCEPFGCRMELRISILFPLPKREHVI